MLHELLIHPLGVDSGHALSPGALAEGAVLRGRRGELRLDGREHDLGVELLRCIHRGEGIGTRSNYLLLDMTGMPRVSLVRTLGPLDGVIRLRTGVDPFEGPIPVRPSPSYCLGGAATDADGHVLDANDEPIGGLFACDECAEVVGQGITTLGPNSYLARVARAATVGRAATSRSREGGSDDVGGESIVERRREQLSDFERIELAALHEWTAELRDVMTEAVLAGATEQSVARARAAVDRLDRHLRTPTAAPNAVDELHAILEFEDMLTLSSAMVDSAERAIPATPSGP